MFVEKIDEFKVLQLTKKLVQEHIEDIVEIIDQIPLVDYSSKEILAESKGERILHSKWDHSLALFDDNKIIGVVIAYEREAEGTAQYPENTLYISELGVSKDYQKKGLGKKLVHLFLKYNQQKGFISLAGEMNFSIQTNSASFNYHVINLYKGLGFNERARKEYDNRVDVVLELLM